MDRRDPDTETAYVLLRDLNVLLDDAIFMDGTKNPERVWQDISLGQQPPPTCCGSKSARPQSPSLESCCSCQLIRHLQCDHERNLQLDWTSIPTFTGVESDVPCRDCQQPRKDVSLLLGLIKTCQDFVQLRRLQVLIQYPRDTSASVVLSSVVVTLSFPLLQQGTPGSRYLLATQAPRISKPLSSALQLILSIVESDWRDLEATMERLVQTRLHSMDESATNTPNSSRSLFPTKLSLSELYRRIPGSSSSCRESPSRQMPPQSPSCHLLSLPKDILTDRVAPFLRAKSLDCLRQTCTTLHNTLQAVVPGLKLRLYSHQKASLHWMRQRECREWTEQQLLQSSSNAASGSDGHRAATGGLTTLLRSKDGTMRIRIYQWTGREVNEEDLVTLPRKVARGGLLCDDPGLGKSITLLSLVLQTNGLLTGLETQDKDAGGGGEQAETDDDSDFFEVYWTDNITPEFQRPMLRRLWNNLLRRNRAIGVIPVKKSDELTGRIDSNTYKTSFRMFEQDARGAISHFQPHSDPKDSYLGAVLASFDELVSELKDDQLRSAKKSFANAAARPNSRVAAMIENRKQKELMDALVPSSATLLIVPSVLMGHWKTQIQMHVDPSYVIDSAKEPLIFIFNQKTAKGDLTVDKARLMIQLYKTHAPFVFLDMATTRRLPPPDFLALFKIVISSNQRFRNEWNNGSFQKELERSTASGAPSYRQFYLEDENDDACPLLKVHWLRMVVDEGHSMAQDKQNSTIQFASWISAERRWAMTGTPTKQTNAQLSQIKNLMSFLQHDFFTPRLDGERFWQTCISRPWNERSLVSFIRLQSLLGLLMKRHTKSDIAELPTPAYRKEVLSMSSVEAATYNAIVCAVQVNLLVCSMGGKPLGEQDSLLHRSQRKFAKEALDNLRRSCTGFSRVVPTLEYKFFIETLELLEKHRIESSRIQTIREQMIGAQEEELYPCDCCRLRLPVLLILPCCGGLACPECMDGSRVCTLCETEFNVDDFQTLQPGFVLAWKSNLEHQAAKRMTSSRRAIPTTVLADGSARDEEHRIGDISSGEVQVRAPLIRPAIELKPTRKYGDHVCEFDHYAAHGRCTLCLHEHDACVLTNEKRRCPTCHRIALPCPQDESKAFYLVQKLRSLHIQRRHFNTGPGLDGFRDQDGRPLKAIVFSQFREVLNVVGSRLILEFGSACVAEFWGKTRQSELQKFTSDSNCFCMLLGKDGSEGLDLSFVTNVFFLEEILDKSLMEQAVARAWRMGARGRVDVETIIARNTVEETMEDMDAFLQGDQALANKYMALQELGKAKPDQLSKTHFLLRSLRLLTDYHYFAESTKGDTADQATAHITKRPLELKISTDGDARTTKRVRFV